MAEADVYESRYHDFRVDTLAARLEYPWGLAFLPGGDVLVTERAGRLRILRDGELLETPVSGVPEVAVGGQGGLLDVILHPQFDDNRLLFLSYAHQTGEGRTTRVARAEYRDGALENVNVIFEALPRSNTTRHFAGRLAFDRDGYLYVPVGDRGDKPRAQDLSDDAGGVHRITIDGQPAPGNPFLDKDGARKTFFTYGNRNIQGMARHPVTGEIWSHEHGPRGGDEVNIIRAGTNYGWPEITYGIDYSGLPITDRTRAPGMAQPLHYWDPSIAPSGLAIYDGEMFPKWRGDLFVGALKFQKVVRLRVNDREQVVEEEDLLTDLGKRIREVKQAPDGSIWLLTDAHDGEILRLSAP
ncbi:PQQ-dependent sugar dehydrogenase [Marinobacter halodurans]|uniref:PQQ-dependent sugar dehydrogenase n=2 Tax=Marinobacter halodurans TaxID=2528979 RepID=A0ABY1ZNC6_9GAMM|nr:PQQ-dependent sugar dehydrogenase [Marinobacter halodurans]TBW57993.1 PQQ-dependent sugar dehydrogenase [Marinobacter halodurans]